MAGRTFSVTTSRGTFDGRALRAKRWLQERRQCARSARITLFSVAQEPRDGERGEELSLAHGLAADYLELGTPHATAWPIFRSCTGARGCGWDQFQVGLRTGEGEGSSGQSTALTRRSLMAVLLS
jgi:hypothetical protein